MRNKQEIRLWFRLSGVLFFLVSFSLQAQHDSIQLKEVIISSYLGDRPVLRLPASVALIDSSQLHRQAEQSLAPVLNTVPGVRMEERSPGSYRLSIRGSLIRSPFGIRNTKIYVDEFPLTNAGGDSYLNLIDLNAISSIEILKGPDGSLFGANSGGIVRLSPFNKFYDSSFVRIGVGAGSYGLLQQNIAVQQKLKRSVISVNEAWQRSDGYRRNSGMDRKFIQLSDRITYNTKGRLHLYFFYSDLGYQTPGGLTLDQFRKDPAQARPATRFVPGAVEQEAAICNRTFFGGTDHELQITEHLRHVISVFGSQTVFENPFITSYETRKEGNAGARTYFELSGRQEADIRLKWNIGGEAQELRSRISNYGNAGGQKDTVQAIDVFEARQGFAFTRLLADVYNRWIVEMSVSYNVNRLLFLREQPVRTPKSKKILRPELMPRIAASYILNDLLSLRAIVSRGYSPPTLQEIRSSDNTVNASLQAESGWNYEAGLRLRDRSNRIYWDISVFYFELDQAIVKRVNDPGQEYFVNAGTIYQPGLESLIKLQVIRRRTTRFIRSMEISQAFTYDLFRFGQYSNEAEDYSGKAVTGVPGYVAVTGATIELPLRFYFFVQHNHTARIPLNDANTDYASACNLVQLKAGWRFTGRKDFLLDISAGVDNLLNEMYSLGNDLNAAGGRYYNSAAPRNYYAKVTVGF